MINREDGGQSMSEDQPKAQELEVRILVLRVSVIGISFLDIGRKPMALCG